MKIYTPTEVDETLKLAEAKGVSIAATEKGVSESTIRLWRRVRGYKTTSVLIFAPEVRAQAVKDWEESTDYNRTTLTAAKHKVSVVTLRKWLKKAGKTLGLAKKPPVSV